MGNLDKRQEAFVTENRMRKLEEELSDLKKSNKNEINDMKDEMRQVAD